MKFLLLNFYESPENYHLESALAKIADRYGIKVDVIHNFKNDYSFLSSIFKSNRKHFTSAKIKDYADYEIFSIDIPWEKDESLLFYLKLIKNSRRKKILIFNHLIPADGHSTGYNYFEKNGIFSVFHKAFFLEFDDRKNIPFLRKKSLCFREYSINTEYYSPENIKAEKENIIFSAGSKGRNFSDLIEAIKDMDIKLKIFSNSDVQIPTYARKKVELSRFNSSLRAIKYHISASSFGVVPIDNEETNPTAGMAVAFMIMSMAKPVIIKRTNWLEKYIIDGYNGIFYDNLSIKNLRKIISFTLRNKKKAMEIGYNARKTAVEKFSMDNLVEKIYTEVLSDG